jgi:hypothetical protein
MIKNVMAPLDGSAADEPVIATVSDFDDIFGSHNGINATLHHVRYRSRDVGADLLAKAKRFKGRP